MARDSEHQQHQQHGESTLTFDPFTRHQFYTDVNRALVERTLDDLDSTHPSGEPVRIVELASGTGAVTQLILDALAHRERPAVIVGVDPSRDAIHRATHRFEGRAVSFVLGDAGDLGSAIGKADAAFFCNAIHLIPDKDVCLAALADALHPGGVLAFNTTFYEGAYVAGSEPFYYALTRRSIGWLRQNHPEVRLGHRGKVTARQWLSPQEYRALVGRHGLAVSYLEEVPVRFPLSAVQDIGRYSLFIEGALPGVPVPIGADALAAAAALAFDDLHLECVPRKWLQLVARRTS
ncbi:MAG TPA: class I SAM-dependent methyltransferase [Ktedonobacterales bacterium]|nr:class I SAM-dependent methyltransferase [Ktedonobacterales bacterium]